MYSTKEYDNLKISLSAGFTDRRGKRKRQTEETRLLAFISFSESCIFETEVFYEKEQEYEKKFSQSQQLLHSLQAYPHTLQIRFLMYPLMTGPTRQYPISPIRAL